MNRLALLVTFCLLAPFARALPTLYIIGDSTVNNSAKGQLGWGKPIEKLFDPAKVHVVNKARGGRSSRSYYAEGLWDQVAAELKPGDFVLMQFGHNDGGSPQNDPKGRASLKGTGDETQEVTDAKTGKTERVHTYGWYLRKYCTDAKAKGATPIVCSPIPRNIWQDEHTVVRNSGDYGKWAAEAAKQTGAQFIDLNEIVARHYDQLGQEKVKSEFFGPTDHTHTTPAGAELNAECVVEGIRGLKDCPLAEMSLKKE
jgi:lysophospholipase L1-like esterase